MITKKTKINNKAQKAKKTKKAKTALNDKNSEDCPGWPKIAKNFACQYILKNSVRNYFGKPCSSYIIKMMSRNNYIFRIIFITAVITTLPTNWQRQKQ